ncbi:MULTISPECIES: Trm112 family protein [Acidobacterium]|uniref:Uncharacterized protein n=1 Tax=Acidobacterium capsulatum (strain ATCC 51196 / DSM 11244 / BCRC 80197 / JCM 7670 / NBRC 15755 / NCIMB 13165 / 161) TaxID=240015 RepID=C1F8S3_ACIC5|nr:MULTISPECIES: Trm112 family protein [Acidobacterium]ACO34220.1 conserved hypothetical protein [Acidobacterium capsulatum ATCC 51196]HCT59848.1 hypothetical protein [Acidobacterium sp.]
MPFQLLDLIVCPACHGPLAECTGQADAPALVCTFCGREYSLLDGIPVLIPDRAKQ